ncbi:energy transducer TonB [Sphingosinithalassobacter portus]|uniref:energy transducer TonB n=1 Tax=Stakelama portus TaxID=2676234 RepID=UPI00137AB3BF|nr:energy transducer TonB [Sphingosinithalassobacter portus]
MLLSLGLMFVLQDHAAPPAPTPIHADRWISSADMPRGVEPFDDARTVGYVLEVDAHGQVTRCAISQPTDSWRLDVTTCRLLPQRAQFEPARDADGNPVTSRYEGRFTWEWNR